MIIEANSTNRYAVYVFYDKNQIADEYNFVLLNAIRPFVKKLLVICNGGVNDEGKAKFEAIADEVILRPNEGFDITAYKLGLFHEGYEKLCEYDEAFIFNSTFFGPLYDLKLMFDSMNQRDVDFWGITAFHEVPFDPFGTIKYGYIPKHIQSYYMTYRKDFMKTNDFKTFWDELPKITNYAEAIGYFETIFTKHMSDLGYKWDTYVNTDDLEGYTYEAMRDFPRYIIESKGCPFFKRRSMYHDYAEALSRSGGEATIEAFNYIKEHTSYDVNLIWDNMLRLENQADLKKRMQSNVVLSSRVLKRPSKLKVALMLHIYYTDLAEFCCEYAKNMPEDADIFVTVPNEEKLEAVKKVFEKLSDRNIDFRIVGNVGRDVAPFLVGCKDVFLNYDLVCKVHDKKVYQLQPMSLGGSWGFKCFENTLKNRTFIENVITEFEDNPKLGMLCPPIPKHGPYYPTTGKGEWGENFRTAKALAEKLGLTVNLSEDKEPVAPLGSMFWIRTAALKGLFAQDWEYEDFPPEPIDVDNTVLHAIERIYPFCVQQEGYYSGWLMVDTFARVELDNFRFINSELEGAMRSKVGNLPHREMLQSIMNL